MRKTRKKGDWRQVAATAKSVGLGTCSALLKLATIAALAAFPAFEPVALAQERSAISTSTGEAERSGRATLGVDASAVDFYNGFNDPTGQAGQAAQTAGIGESGATGRAGQAAQPAGVGKSGATGRVGQAAGETSEEIEFEGEDELGFWAQGPRAWLGPNGWFGREGISASLKTILTFSILAIAPAILLATTSFVRISVVLTLLRQGLGAGQVPSNQTIAALAVFLSLLIMTPVWTEVYEEAVAPYSAGQISADEAFQRGQAPIRTFLWRQIEKTGNAETIGTFTQYIPGAENPEFYEDVPWRALAPAFLLSELKTAFLIGFQILIPLLIIDVVVSSVLVSTGMMMLPPAVVSTPLKLALFVLADGWGLVVKSLLASFAWTGVGG